MKTGLEVNAEEIKHIFTSREQKVGQNKNIKIVNKSPEWPNI
jgi:hypothetical protein